MVVYTFNLRTETYEAACPACGDIALWIHRSHGIIYEIHCPTCDEKEPGRLTAGGHARTEK